MRSGGESTRMDGGGRRGEIGLVKEISNCSADSARRRQLKQERLAIGMPERKR